ncbi:MAG: 2-oxo acid dehydrogenase subunit E2, partial [Gammaproteobacteria bacterium]|nr:2-oxo acid dehydrogenase subunit E2 [Gammaproteobacteria bacterium]
PLATVETDKAVVDIPAPHPGIIEALHAEVGDRLDVGELLLTYADQAATAGTPDRGAVVGELEDSATAATGAVRISPKARRRARVLGVNLREVAGTGPGGSIQLEDVESAAAAATHVEPTGEPLRGVRRAMAERMADAHTRVARASVTGEADISAWTQEQRPLPRLIRAVGIAREAAPRLNAHFDDQAMTLALKTTVDLGVAMETPHGLFVPVLKDVAASGPETLAAELARLESAVADRTIRADELRGQTITLSNFGAVAGLHAEMVVVPPQVAIVGAGRTFERPGPATRPQNILPLSISFDHRVVTGVEACEFLAALTNDLELAI